MGLRDRAGLRARRAPLRPTFPMARPPVSIPASVPAPVGGWNARDALPDMAPLDAVSMVNWFPNTTTVDLRFGCTSWATGLPAQVETLMAYAGAAANKLKAISNGSVYDVTAGGAVGAAEITLLTNSRWQFQNITTAGGSYLVMVNGVDLYRVYDGTAWHKDTDGAPYDITGVASSTLSDVHVFKSRLWFVQKNTLKAWYLPINSIGGAAASLDLSSVFQKGGYIMAMGTWTLDAGYGLDDYAVWITSKGEVAVYQLSDPTTPTGIKLIGLWQIGSPVGVRCFMKYRGDNLIICQDGILPMASALQSSRLDPRVAVSDKIQSAVSTAISTYASSFGWQLLQFPKQNMIILNVPSGTGTQQQYVMNTITGAWANFTGWPANCWELWQDDPYFGGNQVVYKAWSGNDDAGVNIQANALQAFSAFGQPGIKKRFTRIRPILLTNGTPSVLANVNLDFDTTAPTSTLSFTPTAYGGWDAGLWDSAIWGSDLQLNKAWQGANGVGEWAAARIQVACKGVQVQWANTDLVYERANAVTA